MSYAVDLTLFISREDVPAGRLPDRHETREAAEHAGRAAVMRFAAKGLSAEYEIHEDSADNTCLPSSSE